MQSNGILSCRNEFRKVLRIQSIGPQSTELTAAQIGIIADIAEKYGSGQVHITACQVMEIPDVAFGQIIADCVDRFKVIYGRLVHDRLLQ